MMTDPRRGRGRFKRRAKLFVSQSPAKQHQKDRAEQELPHEAEYHVRIVPEQHGPRLQTMHQQPTQHDRSDSSSRDAKCQGRDQRRSGVGIVCCFRGRNAFGFTIAPGIGVFEARRASL